MKRAIAVLIIGCSSTPVDGDAGLDATTEKTPPQDAGDEPFSGPQHLSETGLYSDITTRTIAPGIIEYVPRYPLWSDGESKKRYLYLPGPIDTTSMDDWVFPVGTKVWKQFDAIETRLLWKVSDTFWWEMSYAWNGNDADAVQNGAPPNIPSVIDCAACHSSVRDVLIGVSALQLGASDGDGTLARLVEAGVLTNPGGPFDVPGSGTTKDALGYLHGNCGHCHNSIGVVKTQTNMRLRLSVTDTDPSQAQAYTTSRCLVMKHAIPPDNQIYALVPGDPDASGITVRMNRRDSYGMPPNCTKVVDEAGALTVRAWIASLDAGACD